jgi:hypothetical protein
MKKRHIEVSEDRVKIFMSVFGVSRLAEVLKLFEADYDRCKNTSVKRVNNLYRDYSYAIFYDYSPSSIRNNLVKFKKIIERSGGKYQAIALECFNVRGIYAPIKANDLERKVELKKSVKAEESGAFDTEIVSNVKREIEKLSRTIEDRTYEVRGNQKESRVRSYYMVTVLALATGRRFTEIVKTLKMSRKASFITFSGLLKNNELKISGNIISLKYPDIQRYLREIRKDLGTGDMTEEEVNSKYAKVFNNFIKRVGHKNIKELRHLYSMAGSQLFKIEGETKEETITRILGHKEVFTSALNYT